VWLTENKPSFIRKPHVVISRQSPFAANVVPKLVAVAISLRPLISAMSSLDSLTPKTYPWNQTAIHRFKVYPPHLTHQGDNRCQRWVGHRPRAEFFGDKTPASWFFRLWFGQQNFLRLIFGCRHFRLIFGWIYDQNLYRADKTYKLTQGISVAFSFAMVT